MSHSIYSALGDPLSYPCELAVEPQLILNSEIIPINWNWPEEPPTSSITGAEVDTLLANNGSAGVDHRVAQIAFGANRDVRNILWKFAHRAGDKAVSKDVVMIPGYIEDCDVVACNLGYWGYFYASLLLHRPPALNRPYLAGTRAPVCVLLLDHQQMECIHKSEGVIRDWTEQRSHLHCEVAHFDVTLTNDVVVTAQLYALSLPYLSYDKFSPVPFKKVETLNRSSGLPPMSQLEMFDKLVQQIEVDVPDEFCDRPGMWVAKVLRDHKLNGAREKSELYIYIREQIIQRLCLHDGDGVVRCGNDGLSAILPFTQAWSLTPTLQQQM